jgi:hypothetical protein
MHGKGERDREASKGLFLASYIDDAMVELVELESGSAQARARKEVKRRPQGERKEQGDAHGLLTSSCDDGRARLMRMAVYSIREASEARAGKRVTS